MRRQVAVAQYLPISVLRRSAVGQTVGVRGGEIDHQSHHGARLMSDPPQSDAPHLDQAGERFGGPRQQSPAGGFQINTIVGDKPGNGNEPPCAPLR